VQEMEKKPKCLRKLYRPIKRDKERFENRATAIISKKAIDKNSIEKNSLF
jgi:hypothetical protein